MIIARFMQEIYKKYSRMISSFCKFQAMQNIFFLLLFLFSACEDTPIGSSDSSCGDINDSCSNPISFMLEDLNTTSSTHCELVGPDTWEGEIRLFYFSSNEQ